MTTPMELANDYIFMRDLRDSTATTYVAAVRALLRHFGQQVKAEQIDQRAVLTWRRKVLEDGLSKRSWNTYSNHLRTLWGHALEQGLLPRGTPNPFRRTSVIPPKRQSKTVAPDAIRRARQWLTSMVADEHHSGERCRITPAWFWLTTFEMFYYTGIRLNALLCVRLQDVDWDNQMILVRGETEKTHREFQIPIMEGLAPHLRRLLDEAAKRHMKGSDQLFNVNRFSPHYSRREMDTHQVEGMYRKLTEKIGVRMTPHRFRHTLATDLMRQPDRNIHLTRSLLNHSNIATTMSYIEADYDQLRQVLHERSLAQGAFQPIKRTEDSDAPGISASGQPSPDPGVNRVQELNTEALMNRLNPSGDFSEVYSGELPLSPSNAGFALSLLVSEMTTPRANHHFGDRGSTAAGRSTLRPIGASP